MSFEGESLLNLSQTLFYSGTWIIDKRALSLSKMYNALLKIESSSYTKTLQNSVRRSVIKTSEKKNPPIMNRLCLHANRWISSCSNREKNYIKSTF